jgi:hypothetical protein
METLRVICKREACAPVKTASNPHRIVEGAINHPVLKKFRYILLPLSAILTHARVSALDL